MGEYNKWYKFNKFNMTDEALHQELFGGEYKVPQTEGSMLCFVLFENRNIWFITDQMKCLGPNLLLAVQLFENHYHRTFSGCIKIFDPVKLKKFTLKLTHSLLVNYSPLFYSENQYPENRVRNWNASMLFYESMDKNRLPNT